MHTCTPANSILDGPVTNLNTVHFDISFHMFMRKRGSGVGGGGGGGGLGEGLY